MSRQSIQAGKAVIVIDLADQATAKFSGLVKSMSAKMMQASRSMRDTALNSTAGFIVTKMAVGSLVKDFVSFEDKILNLTAKMGFFGNKTAAQTSTIADLRNHIMYLGRTTAFTSQEVADAAISLAQAGFSADELKASLKGTLDFARGTNYALGESADMVANLVRTFDLFGANDTLEQRVSKITSLTSQLVKTTRLGTVEIQDLRESLKYAGGSANNLGIELPVLLGFLTQMSESGLKASLAGTSLNTALLNMIKSSAKLKEIAPNFQIITDTQGNENLVATMYGLFKISNRMSKVQRAAFFQDIFNIRGARATSAVQEMDRVDKFIKQIQNAGAESALAASLMESGAGGAIRRLTSAFETLRITIFELYAKEFTAFTNGLAYLTTISETATVKYKGLILAFLLSPVIFGATAIGAITLSFVLARLARALQLVATAGRGLKFLGGSLLSAAKGTASLFGPKGPSRAAQIATQMKSVAKLQGKINVMTAAAQGKKTAGGRVKAMAAVTNSKSMQKLVAATQKLQSLQKLPANSLLGVMVRGTQGVKNTTVALARATKAQAVRLATIYKEQQEIKSQIGLEKVLGKAEHRRTVAQLKSIKDVDVKQGSRLARASKYEQQALRAKERAVVASKVLNKQQNYYNRLNKAYQLVAPKQIDAGLNLAKTPGIGNLGRMLQVEEFAKKRTALQKELRAMEDMRITGDGTYDPEKRKTLQKQAAGYKGRETILKKQIARQTNIVSRSVRAEEIAKRAIKLKSSMGQTQDAVRQAMKENRNYLNLSDATQNKIARATQVNNKKSAARQIIGQRYQQNQAARAARIASAKQALSSTKYGGISSLATKAGGGIAAGFKSLKGMMSGAGLVKAGQGILTLAGGFLKLAGSVARFVFSWNFVGMVFNVLLMFGDKIPSVVAAFNALGSGISGAFGEIGKVFAYAAPAMKLFQLAFNAFLQGDTGTGVAALQTAFSGIVDIIGNQLVAAWNTFMKSVGYLWTTLQQVFMSIKNIIMSIFEGITKIFGVVASPIFSSLQDIFGAATGGAAGGGLQSFAIKFVQGLDYFITRFFQGAIFLHQQLMEFVAEFQRVIGQIISEIPGTGQSGAAIQRDAQTTKSMAEMRSSMARGSLESSMKQRSKDLANIFSVDTAANARQRNMAAEQANGRSSQTSVDMVHAMTVLSDQFAQNMRDRTDEINRLQQGKLTTPGQPGQGVADQLTRDLPKYLQALSGSVMSTRAIYRVDTKRQEDIMKDQLKAQQETNRLLSLGGGIP